MEKKGGRLIRSPYRLVLFMRVAQEASRIGPVGPYIQPVSAKTFTPPSSGVTVKMTKQEASMNAIMRSTALVVYF